VLRIASPGGAVLAGDLIWEEVRRLAEAKPLVVSFGSVAASAAYYIVAPAKTIFALPTTITGSIGVVGFVPSFQEFEKKYGITFHLFSSSDRRNILNPGKRADQSDIKIMQKGLDQAYDSFLTKVAEGRGMSREAVHLAAQGRVWSGVQAQKMGLVDQLGGLWEAIQEAKKEGGFQADDDVPLLRSQLGVPSLIDCLHNMRRCVDFSPSALTGVGGVESKLMNWAAYVRDEPVQAIWPGFFGSIFQFKRN
jgi:protease IV